VIDEATPDVGSQENLLALTFEIKELTHPQNERIGSMTDTVNETLDAAHAALTEWGRRAEGGGASSRGAGGEEARGAEPLEGRSLIIHQRLQETTSACEASPTS